MGLDAAMSDVAPIALKGLVLRLPRETEAADALAMLRDPDVVRWNGAPRVVDLDSAREWCRRGADWSSGTHHTFSVVDATTDRLLGNVSLFNIDHDNGTTSVGYRTAPWARRQGVASTGLSGVTEWAFRERGLFRVELRHAVPNVASCGVARRAGFGLEATLRLAGAAPDRSRHDEHLHACLQTDNPSA
jgi:RimJ/RimL family protein N-acetyltransferase